MRSRDRLGAWCCCDLVGLGWNALRGFGEASETAVRETADHRHQRVEVLQRTQTLKKKSREKHQQKYDLSLNRKLATTRPHQLHVS